MSKKSHRSSKKPAPSATRVSKPRGRQHRKTKKQIALSLLQRSKGASVAEMQSAMDWQAHSVRGFLAGTVKKMPDVVLTSVKAGNGPRRYRIEAAQA